MSNVRRNDQHLELVSKSVTQYAFLNWLCQFCSKISAATGQDYHLTWPYNQNTNWTCVIHEKPTNANVKGFITKQEWQICNLPPHIHNVLLVLPNLKIIFYVFFRLYFIPLLALIRHLPIPKSSPKNTPNVLISRRNSLNNKISMINLIGHYKRNQPKSVS